MMKKAVLTFCAVAMLLPVQLLAEAKPDRRTTTDAFDDWAINCIEQEDKRLCEMKQNLLNQNQALVAVLSLAKKPDGNMLFQIALPHLLDLTKPVAIIVDDKQLATPPFNFCNKTACFVVPADAESLIKAFRKGNSGRIQSVTITGEPIVLGFSLKGFSAAIDSLGSR
jgi:invasion protein IalB